MKPLRLYVVTVDQIARPTVLVADDTGGEDGRVAAYKRKRDAEKRRKDMAARFPKCIYKVVAIEVPR